MSEASGVKLIELLPGDLSSVGDTMESAMGAGAGDGPLKLALRFVRSEAVEAFRNVLDCDVFELIANAWCKARELREYADPKQHPLGETSLVQLGDHELTQEVHPTLNVSVGAFRFPTLRFTIELTAHFRSAVLSIRDGRIIAIAAGNCSVGAALKYGEAEIVPAKESQKVQLPGRINFAPPGIAIV